VKAGCAGFAWILTAVAWVEIWYVASDIENSGGLFGVYMYTWYRIYLSLFAVAALLWRKAWPEKCRIIIVVENGVAEKYPTSSRRPNDEP
jgi:hypothetical protein